ncbi:MAG: Rnf-Nqr domain containing protein [Flavonifractor plautii]
MNVMKQFRDGLFFQNPVTVQLLGMCSVMAITTTLFNGLGMGLSVLVILTLSNIIIAALRQSSPTTSASPASSWSSPALLPSLTCACRHLSRPCPRAWACLSP